jgi:DNA-binding NtrC family response regulator
MSVDRPTILCIDDEAVILLAMRQELRRRFGDRYAIETALGAAEALEAIAAVEAAGSLVVLVICDWYMPVTLGDRFLASLHRSRPDIKSILMTGQTDADAIVRAQAEAGICACVHKPWRPQELAEAIEACLGTGAARCA